MEEFRENDGLLRAPPVTAVRQKHLKTTSHFTSFIGTHASGVLSPKHARGMRTRFAGCFWN